MVGLKDDALALHDKGFNCAQSVLGACGKYSGLDHLTAMNIAGSLGGGVRCGEICGAVIGGSIVLSCAFPFNDAARPEDKARIAVLTKRFTDAFKEKYGCIRCVDLKRKGVNCSEIIAFCAELAEEMIINKNLEDTNNGNL